MPSSHDQSLVRETMEALREQGKPKTSATYRRHGATGTIYGVSFTDLAVLAKRIGKNHAVAQLLWATDVHDARVLATQVADASEMSAGELEGWVHEADNQVINDAVATAATRVPGALQLALRWVKRPEEWVSAAGWTVIGGLARDGALDDETANRLLATIQEHIQRSKNRTKYAMNNALIAIGGYLPEQREAALAAADAIGRVEVDHGETDCKTPDARGYIERMAKRVKNNRLTTASSSIRPGARQRAKHQTARHGARH
jgi:3-methyladenine DNA glycosylase AlkD